MSWNIYGHEWAANQLQRHIIHNQVQHAYLFTGPSGVGKRTLALQFARALNCLNPVEEGEACGQCRTCMQIERMQHADLSVVQAVDEEGNARVGGTLKIEQIRDLQHMLSLTPNEAKYRISLILRFHEANVNAQNALLKTLEEAPRHVILLLTADDNGALLETITSRCEIFRLRPLPVNRLSTVLQGQLNISSDEAMRLSYVSNGRPGFAINCHQNPEILERWQGMVGDLLQLLHSSRRERFSYVEDLTTRRATKAERQMLRENIRQMYEVWLSFWRDVLLSAGGCGHLIVNREWGEEISFVAQNMGMEIARHQAESVRLGIEKIRANLDVRLLTEVLLLEMPYLN